MNNRLDYYKEFWMIKKLDDENSEKNPIGYVKLEVKDKRGYINLFISHIKDNIDYKVYLIRKDKSMFKSVFMGDLMTSKNIGILSYQFNPFNVDNKGYDITKYNVVAIVKIVKSDNNTKIISKAVAYKNQEVPWQESLEHELLIKDKNIFCPINYLSQNSLVFRPFSVELFKRQMDNNFTRCNPFFNERQDYIWWHIFNVCKLWYILRMFNIEVPSAIVNNMILGVYKNDTTSKFYIVLGYLINNNCEYGFDKIVNVFSEKFKVKLKYGLNFIRLYEKEQAN